MTALMLLVSEFVFHITVETQEINLMVDFKFV
jgi:hypothetical protein